MLPSSGLVLAGSASSRTLSLVPVAGQTGVATVTVTVSDDWLDLGAGTKVSETGTTEFWRIEIPAGGTCSFLRLQVERPVAE